MAEHNEIGKIGEKVAQTFLMKHGFTITSLNYRTKFGEIDIVAKKDNRLHFIEVKSVKVRNFEEIDTLRVKPEDNLTWAKWKKFVTTVEIYLKQYNQGNLGGVLWQVDLACVYINTEIREGRVKLLENVHK